MENNPISIEQPSPKFTLIDLEQLLGSIYRKTINFTKQLPVENTDLKEANGILQGLIAQVAKNIRDLEPIDITKPESPEISYTFKQDKPSFHVVGVQLIENGKLVGTSLYSTVVKARAIRDTLNKEFARLKVNHEAKIINYPVF